MAAPFSEFVGNKRLLWIAQEWDKYSDELAEWAMEHLVNRRDVWGQYTVREGEVGFVTLPIPERRGTGSDMVTMQKLRRHFAGRAASHLISLHSISDHDTCKWFSVDIDLHDPTVLNADELAADNLSAALAWARRLREQLFDPCVIDTNGCGGYHLLVLLDKEYPLAEVYDFVNELRSDWDKFNLPRKPECFPPRREVAEGHLPYPLRVPGRHHTFPHYSRVWNFDGMGENEWLEGAEAIEALLALRPAELKVAPSVRKTARTLVQKKKEVKRKPKVCVDLDGVLAKYENWRGPDQIGPPLPGAMEFMTSLAQIADILIFTTRCSSDHFGEHSTLTSPGRLKIRVIDWLEKYNFPYSDVYVGQGKPHALAFIDDRGVNCSPQKDPDAFTKALAATRALVNPRSAKETREMAKRSEPVAEKSRPVKPKKREVATNGRLVKG